MLPEALALGPFSIPTFGFFAAFSFVVASFLLWRPLREDYPEEEIFTFTIYLALFSLVGARIFYLADHFADFGLNPYKWIFFPLYPGFSLVGGFFGGIFLSNFWTRQKNWNFWVLTDNLIPIFLLVFLIGSFGLVLEAVSQSFKILLALFVLAASVILAKHYRKFIWYKSGKPGFVASFSTAFFFLGTFALDFWTKTGLYLELAGALVLGIAALVLLYRRSDRVAGEDLTALGGTLGGLFKRTK